VQVEGVEIFVGLVQVELVGVGLVGDQLEAKGPGLVRAGLAAVLQSGLDKVLAMLAGDFE
jgi:hypothetical protein